MPTSVRGWCRKAGRLRIESFQLTIWRRNKRRSRRAEGSGEGRFCHRGIGDAAYASTQRMRRKVKIDVRRRVPSGAIETLFPSGRQSTYSVLTRHGTVLIEHGEFGSTSRVSGDSEASIPRADGAAGGALSTAPAHTFGCLSTAGHGSRDCTQLVTRPQSWCDRHPGSQGDAIERHERARTSRWIRHSDCRSDPLGYFLNEPLQSGGCAVAARRAVRRFDAGPEFARRSPPEKGRSQG